MQVSGSGCLPGGSGPPGSMVSSFELSEDEVGDMPPCAFGGRSLHRAPGCNSNASLHPYLRMGSDNGDMGANDLVDTEDEVSGFYHHHHHHQPQHHHHSPHVVQPPPPGNIPVLHHPPHHHHHHVHHPHHHHSHHGQHLHPADPVGVPSSSSSSSSAAAAAAAAMLAAGGGPDGGVVGGAGVGGGGDGDGGSPYRVQRHAANVRERKRMLRSARASGSTRPPEKPAVKM